MSFTVVPEKSNYFKHRRGKDEENRRDSCSLRPYILIQAADRGTNKWMRSCQTAINVIKAMKQDNVLGAVLGTGVKKEQLN